MFVALIVGSGWALAMVPNVEFITALAFTAGASLGPLRGALVGIFGMFLFSATNPVGSGLAFPVLLAAQIISQGLTGLSGGWLRRWTNDVQNSWLLRIGLAVTGLALTLIYDGLTTISFPLFARASPQEIGVVLVSGLAFLYGGIATGRPGPALVPACFAFLFHLGREILKDAQDEVGDRAAGARTLPAVVGVPGALRWAGLVFSILIAATPIPHLVGHYSLAYLIIVVFGVDFPLLYVIFSSQRNSSPDHLGRLSLLLKVDMWVGLVAILAGIWM